MLPTATGMLQNLMAFDLASERASSATTIQPQASLFGSKPSPGVELMGRSI